MIWRTRIEELAKDRAEYGIMRRAGAPESRSIRYAVQRMVEEAAENMSNAQDDEVADLAGFLALLTTYAAFPGECVLSDMTDEERRAVSGWEKP